MFVPLGIHSYYSLGWGTASPEAICERVKSFGCEALAVTDLNNLYGLFFLRDVARDSGLKLIIGAEIDSRDGREKLTLHPMNEQGYRNLCKIITNRQIEPSFDLIDDVTRNGEGLLALVNCEDHLARLAGVVPELRIELKRGAPNYQLIKAARRSGVKVVASEASYWVDDDGYRLHRVQRAIHLNIALGSLGPEDCAGEKSQLIDEGAMLAAFSFAPEAVENTLEVAELCRFMPSFGVVYPPIPDELCGKADDILRSKAYLGALKRYGEITDAVRNRLEHELDVIAQKGFAPVFLVVDDIVRQAPRTAGRGSAAASIVSYALGITQVDPIRHKLYFERFISPSRKDAPDIDIDFPWDERDGVIDYVFRRFGDHRTAMVANHNSFQDRSAIHEVAKVFGLPEAEITAITKRLGGGYGWLGLSVTDHPGLAGHGFPAPWPEILSTAKRLEEVPRHLSVHCGGIVVTPGQISDWAPTEIAPKGVRILQWEKDQTEGSGLVKIDLLGNRSLAVIRDASQAVQEHWGNEIDFDKQKPVDDPLTQELMASGQTMGVFYVESPSARMLQQKAAVGDYEHLVLHTSIIRPAANKFINLYLARLKGEPWKPLHPLLGDLLDDNYGIMIYQEDVTRVAIKLAGFEHPEADELRKILSQKHKKRRLIDLMNKFYAGASAAGATKERIDEIWEMIMSFAGYSFCKPHSASYALVSFQSGYIKAHYPAEFMAAVILNQGGFYATFAYISEAKRLGLNVLQPDINLSNVKYEGKGDWLRIGLMQIKSLPSAVAERVVAERAEGGLYQSLRDAVDRAGLTPSDASQLIKAGCFDRVEAKRTRPEMLWEVSLLDREGAMSSRSQALSNASKHNTLFAVEPDPRALPKSSQYDLRTLRQLELETLGFLASCHPLDLYRDRIQRIGPVKAVNLGRYVGRRVEAIGWLVTSKLVLTVHRDPMEFVTFEDTTGLIEAILFPEAYKRFSHILSYTRPYRLRGVIDEQYSVITMNVEAIDYL